MSVVANVAINVDSRDAISKLRQVQSQASATEKAFDGINRTANGLRTALAGVGIAGIVAQTTRAAASFNDLQLRLKLLTSQYGETAKAQEIVAKSAKTFGLSTREATAGIANIFARLRPLGVSLKDIETTFAGFNTVAKLSGVGAAEASAAFTQLAQALGSGRLQGDEFRSISEQVPGILVAISKETGIAAGELKDYAKEGKLTSEIVINALARIEKEGAGKIAKIIQESDVQKFKNFQNAVDDLSIAIGNDLLPTVTPLVQEATKLVRAIADLPQPVKSAALDLAKLATAVFLLSKAIQGVIALRVALVGVLASFTTATVATGVAATASSKAFALYAANAKTLEAASATATTKAAGLLGVLRGLAAIGVITVGINLIVTGLQEAMAAAAETRRLRGERGAGGAAAIFGGSATKGQKQTAAQTLQAIRKEQGRYQQPGTIAAQTLLGPLAPLVGLQTTAQTGARRTVLGERALRAQAVMGLPTRVEQAATGLGGGATGAGAGEGGEEDKKAAKQRAQLEARIRGIRMETESTKQLALIRGKIAQAEIAGDQQLAIRLQGEERTQQILQEYQASLEGVTDSREKQALFAKAQAQIDAVGLQTAAELEKLQADRTKAIEEAMADINNQIAVESQLTNEGRRQVELEQKVQEFKKANKGISEDQVNAYRKANQELDKTKQKIADIKKEQQALDDLYGGIAGQIAGGVGGAIDAVTNSTENLGQALANIGQEILAAVGKMLIFYALAQALGALGGKDGVGIFSYLAKGFGYKGAKDGAYWPGGFQAFADGGMVTSPTMGLIGEGGEPEYVIPASKMRGAMNRYAAGARGSAVIPAGGGGDGGTATMAAAPAAIDVRYTVERINSVDYVTADQFQRGMQQAATEGAMRGEQRALSTLRQNTTQRRKIGL